MAAHVSAEPMMWLMAPSTALAPFQLVAPPPPRVAPLPVNVNTAVFAVIVRFAVCAIIAVDPVVSVIALAPSVSVFVPVLIVRLAHEHVCPFVFNVPAVNVIAPVNVVPALCISVKSDLLMVMEAAERATSTVTVAAVPELESKVTVSPATGTVSPPAPPVVADQCAVSLVLPVPPTQNLLAIFIPRKVMVANIFREGRQLKVGQTVVPVVAIDVVDYFRPVELPAQMVFHKLPVL